MSRHSPLGITLSHLHNGDSSWPSYSESKSGRWELQRVKRFSCLEGPGGSVSSKGTLLSMLPLPRLMTTRGTGFSREGQQTLQVLKACAN